MPDYAPERAIAPEPTQVQHPVRAALRTVAAYAASTAVTAAESAITTTCGLVVTPDVHAAAVLILTAAQGGLCTWLMARPGVDQWLTDGLDFGARPKKATT